MEWRNLKLGSKFFVAFGAIITLLIIYAFWAISGIGGIVQDATEVIDGNKLRVVLEDKYTQHLKWAQEVSNLLTNDNISELNVETDPHKCSFGIWYYSNKRNEAEELAPELKSLFDQFETPHNQLHQTAIKINDKFEQVDWELAAEIKQAEIDHINWMNKVKEAIFIRNLRTIDVVTDPAKCNFGIWLNSNELKKLRLNHPETETIIEAIEASHNELHQSAIYAERYQQSGNNSQARIYFNNTILKNTNAVLANLEDFISWHENDLMGMKEANSIYQQETIANLTEMGDLFEKVMQKSNHYILTDQVMLKEASNTRIGIIIFSLVAVVLSVVLAMIISRGILKPLKASIDFAGKVSGGDLNATVDIDQKDEIGELVNALKGMVGKLGVIVSDIKHGSDHIALASQEMSDTSLQLSQGTTEQAASLEEVSSTMEEITSNIDQNSQNSLQTE